MIAANDILQILDVQTCLGERMLNVYFYRVNALEGAADYGDVSTAFVTGVMEEVEAVQFTGTVHTSVIISNLTNGLDIFESALTGHIGEFATTEASPSLVALGFRLLRATALTRHGAKRIGGIAEGVTQGNSVVGGSVGICNTIANAMAANIAVTGTVDHDISLSPVIVGRIPVGDPGAGGLDLSRVNSVAGGQFIRVTSQVTRRAGRGT